MTPIVDTLEICAVYQLTSWALEAARGWRRRVLARRFITETVRRHGTHGVIWARFEDLKGLGLSMPSLAPCPHCGGAGFLCERACGPSGPLGRCDNASCRANRRPCAWCAPARVAAQDSRGGG